MEAIQKTFSEDTEDVVDVPTVGSPYCAQSPEDDKWYRAVVRHLGNDNHVNVTLVDLGKALTVPVERLKAISDELVTCLPRQALHCSLVDLEPADAEWSAHAVTKMTEVCSGKELEGIFRSRHHKVYNIYLRDPENDASDFVNKLLVDLKLAKVTGRDSDSGEVSKICEFHLPKVLPTTVMVMYDFHEIVCNKNRFLSQGTDSNGNNDFNAGIRIVTLLCFASRNCLVISTKACTSNHTSIILRLMEM
jgi:hypothetical protein